MRGSRAWIKFRRIRFAFVDIMKTAMKPPIFDGPLVRLVRRMASSRSTRAVSAGIPPAGTGVIKTHAAELFRVKGSRFRSIHLYVHADGSVRLDAHDMGTSVEEVWGDSEYEFWVDVPATELHKLVFALLREKYRGREQAVDEFTTFCKQEAIERKWGSYA